MGCRGEVTPERSRSFSGPPLPGGPQSFPRCVMDRPCEPVDPGLIVVQENGLSEPRKYRVSVIKL